MHFNKPRAALRERPEKLERFIAAARTAYTSLARDPRAAASVRKVFDAVDASTGDIRSSNLKLPVRTYLGGAVATSKYSKPLGDLAEAFLALEPELGWRRRLNYDRDTASDNFHDGHGNCMVIGPGGYEDRAEIGLGVSLLAPHVRYPEHDHPPEETYLVASEGMFRQGEGMWFSPGVGGRFITSL